MRRLLIRPGAIGDFLVSLPALESLRGTYTELWCPAAVAPLAGFADYVSTLVGSGVHRVGITEATDVLTRMSTFDEIHSWYGTNQPDFRNACHGLPIRFYTALPEGGTLHATDFYLQQVGAPPGAIPAIALPAGQRENYAVLHPFSGSPRKNWPPDRWRELGRLLEPRMAVHWCCGPEEEWPGATVIPDLRDLAIWLSKARVFSGNDSGISHLAAAVGTPTVVLFGPSDANVWAPRGAHVTVLQPLHLLRATSVAEAVP